MKKQHIKDIARTQDNKGDVMKERIESLLEILKGERRRSGILQKELAEKSGIGIGTIWRLEQNRYSVVDIFKLERICRALGFKLKIELEPLEE